MSDDIVLPSLAKPVRTVRMVPADELDALRAEVVRLTQERDEAQALIRTTRLFGTGFVWVKGVGERVALDPREVVLVFAHTEPPTGIELQDQLAVAQRDLAAMRDVVAKARELVEALKPLRLVESFEEGGTNSDRTHRGYSAYGATRASIDTFDALPSSTEGTPEP